MTNTGKFYWNILLCIGAVSIFSAPSHAAPKPVLHKATARIHVFDPDSYLDPSKPGALSSVNPYFLRTQIVLIQSKPILHEVAIRLNLAEAWSVDGKKLSTEAIHKILKQSLRVYQQRDTSLIAISVQRSDPVEAVRIANEIAEAFRDARLEVLEKKNRAALASFEAILKEQKDRVAAAEKKVEQLRIEYKVPADESNRVDVQNMRLMRLENERVTTQMAMIETKAKLQILEDHAEEDLLERASFTCFDPLVLNSIQQIQEIKIQITLLEAEQGDEHPELKQSRLRKQKLENTLAARLIVLEKILETEYTLSEKMFEALDTELDGLQFEAISRLKKEIPYRHAVSTWESEQLILKQLEAKLQLKAIRREFPRNPVEMISPAKPPVDPPFSAKRGASYNRTGWVWQGYLV